MATGLSKIHNLDSSMHNILACSHGTGVLKVEWCPNKQSRNCYIRPVTSHYVVIVLFLVLENDVIRCYVYRLVLLMIICINSGLQILKLCCQWLSQNAYYAVGLEISGGKWWNDWF